MKPLLAWLIILLSPLTLAAAPGAADPAAPAAPAAAAPATPAAPAAKSPPSPLALLPEGLNAKAFLEDLLARRYTQGLSTVVDRQAFSLGAQLELVEAPKPVKNADGDPADDLPADLLVGTIDPDDLLKRYAGPEETAALEGILHNYRIRSVEVAVGLREDLSAETKADVEKWLTARIDGEFGTAGKGTVSTIRAAAEKNPVPKSMLDWLTQFQSLAGQLVLALAIVIGAILWKILSRPPAEAGAKSSGSQSVAITAIPPTPPGPDKAELDHAADRQRKREEEEQAHAAKELNRIRRSLSELAPRLEAQYDNVIRTWCQSGEEGKLKLACFAEAVGKELGKLPIPIDSFKELSSIFAKMPEISLKDKAAALNRVYWDLLAAINLGADTLEQPFGYLGALNLDLIDKTLMAHNPKMKTLVALYMPSNLREGYVQSLSAEGKREMLENAAGLSEIAVDELRSFDQTLKSELGTGGGRNVVPIEHALGKIVAAMSPREEIELLGDLSGGAFEQFRRRTPSLAFLPQMKDEALAVLFGNSPPDEVVAYLRVRPELEDRIIALLPRMTAKMSKDELSRADTTSDDDKGRFLAQLSGRLRELVENKEINLENAFEESGNPSADESDASSQAA